jgi:dTDP-4-amino-4,6-dideoxygalactose transaminase
LLAPLPITTPYESPDVSHVYHQYTIRVEASPEGREKRDALSAHLNANGIGNMIYYPVPIHEQGLYANQDGAKVSLPLCEVASRQVLSLPIFPELTEEQQVRIAGAIREFYSRDL